MDWVHLFLAVGTVVEILSLCFIAWAAINVQYTTYQVEDTAKKIAEMANRNERMTQDILMRVHNVSRPNA